MISDQRQLAHFVIQALKIVPSQAEGQLTICTHVKNRDNLSSNTLDYAPFNSTNDAHDEDDARCIIHFREHPTQSRLEKAPVGEPQTATSIRRWTDWQLICTHPVEASIIE